MAGTTGDGLYIKLERAAGDEVMYKAGRNDGGCLMYKMAGTTGRD